MSLLLQRYGLAVLFVIAVVFFLAVSVSGLALAGVDNWVDSIFNGAALVIAVALSTSLGKRRRD